MEKSRIEKIGNSLVVLCLFLAAMNFGAKFFYLALGAAAILIATRKTLKVNKAFFLCLFFGIVLGMYDVDGGGLKALIRPLAYCGLYLVGCNFTKSEDLNFEKEKKASLLVSVFSLGAFSHFMLNFFSNRGNDIGRNTLDFWTGETLSATGQAALASLMIGLSVAWLLAPPKWFFRIFSIVAIAGVFFYSLILAGRTVFAIFALVFILGFLFLLWDKGLRGCVKPLSLVVILTLSVVIAWSLDIGGFKTIVMESNIYQRFSETSFQDLINTGRSERKIYFLQNMLNYPFGGANMRAEVGYAHDLLLDAYDAYGVGVFVLLVLILLEGIKEAVKFCRNRKTSLRYRMPIFCVYMSVLMEFFVEPIFASTPWIFAFYCLLNGCLYGLNNTGT